MSSNDDEADEKSSTGSQTSAQQVDKMIHQANKKFVVAMGSASTIFSGPSGPADDAAKFE